MMSEADLQEHAKRLEHSGPVMSGALVSASEAIEALGLDPALKARFMALGAAMAKASTLAVIAGQDLGIIRFDVDSGEIWVEQVAKP